MRYEFPVAAAKTMSHLTLGLVGSRIRCREICNSEGHKVDYGRQGLNLSVIAPKVRKHCERTLSSPSLQTSMSFRFQITINEFPHDFILCHFFTLLCSPSSSFTILVPFFRRTFVHSSLLCVQYRLPFQLCFCV